MPYGFRASIPQPASITGYYLNWPRTPAVEIFSQLARIVIFVSAGSIVSRIDAAYSTAVFAWLEKPV